MAATGLVVGEGNREKVSLGLYWGVGRDNWVLGGYSVLGGGYRLIGGNCGGYWWW
jgi:hypothetical protein